MTVLSLKKSIWWYIGLSIIIFAIVALEMNDDDATSPSSILAVLAAKDKDTSEFQISSSNEPIDESIPNFNEIKRIFHASLIRPGSHDMPRMMVEEWFSCPNPEWSQVGLDIYGESERDASGYSLSLSADGQILVISSVKNDGVNGTDTGHVRVFRRDTTEPLGWVQIGQDLEGGTPYDGFGDAVALSNNGKMLAVGSRMNDSARGFVRIFQMDSASPLGWTQIGKNIHGRAHGVQFGDSIALSGSGDVVVIAATASHSNKGHVQVYSRDPSSALGWAQVGEDLEGSSSSEQFGRSVAISNSGDMIVIGAPAKNSGYVRVYRREPSVALGWEQYGVDIGGEGNGDSFGHSLALSDSGEILAIGGYLNDGNSTDVTTNSGHVRIFQKNTSSTSGWTQIGRDLEGDGTVYELFGWSLALSSNGDTVAVGARQMFSSLPGYGRVYHRDQSSNLGWVRVGEDFEGVRTSDQFGWSIALSGNGEVVAISSTLNTNVNGFNGGNVQVFQLCNQTYSTDLSSLSLDPFSWDINLVTPGYLKDPPIQDGVQEFITIYEISDRDFEIQVFQTDCKTPSAGFPLVDIDDSKTSSISSLKATLMYNQSIIQSSNLWTANSTGGDVDFCIKLSLYTNTTSDRILFNFVETIYKIQVDLTTGFTSAVDVIRSEAGDGGVEVIDTNENITAFQCDDTFDKLDSPPSLNQGDSLQICVETEADSVFEVGRIKDVTVSQNGTKSFNYVTLFKDSFWADTSCMALNTTASKCKVRLQLLGDYFDDVDPTDLTVKGVVKLDYLGRRLFQDGETLGNRELSMEEEESNSMFTLNVVLSPKLDEIEVGIDDNDVVILSADSASRPYGCMYGNIFLTLMVIVATKNWMN